MRLAALALAAALGAAPAAALAADGFEFTPYIWIPSVDGTVGQGGGDSNTGDVVVLDFSQDLKIGGAMVNLVWREGNFVAFADWTYANVTGKSPMPAGWAYSDIEVQVRGNVGQLFTGYEFLNRKAYRLAGFTGARLYNLYGRITLAPAAWSGQELAGDQTWLDAVGGVRFEWDLAERWWLHVTGDAGTGGSNLSWQAFAMGGYRFGWGSLILGYRHLYLDKGEDRTKVTLTLSGPTIGADFRW